MNMSVEGELARVIHISEVPRSLAYIFLSSSTSIFSDFLTCSPNERCALRTNTRQIERFEYLSHKMPLITQQGQVLTRGREEMRCCDGRRYWGLASDNNRIKYNLLESSRIRSSKTLPSVSKIRSFKSNAHSAQLVYKVRIPFCKLAPARSKLGNHVRVSIRPIASAS